jgi:hypothetical protein
LFVIVQQYGNHDRESYAQGVQINPAENGIISMVIKKISHFIRIRGFQGRNKKCNVPDLDNTYKYRNDYDKKDIFCQFRYEPIFKFSVLNNKKHK